MTTIYTRGNAIRPFSQAAKQGESSTVRLFSELRPLFKNARFLELVRLADVASVASVHQLLPSHRQFESVHEDFLGKYTRRRGLDCIVLDGINITRVLYVDDSLIIEQRVWIYGGRGSGHSIAPSRFTVTRTKDTGDLMKDDFTIEYGFGVKDKLGELRHPCRTKHCGAEFSCPEKVSDWAIYHRRVIRRLCGRS